MGNSLRDFYRERVKPAWKVAFFSVFLVGILTHIYKFTNYLPDRDSLLNIYHDQNILASGRWALSMACGISSYFDLPMVNGLLSLIYMGLTMVLVVELLELTNPVLIALCGALLATFPGTTETFLYEYTADGYFLAMLLATVGVYATRMSVKNRGCMSLVDAACASAVASISPIFPLLWYWPCAISAGNCWKTGMTCGLICAGEPSRLLCISSLWQPTMEFGSCFWH